MLKIRIKGLAFVKAETNGSSLVIKPLFVADFQIKVDQVDGHGATLFEPEGRNWKRRSVISLNVKFVDSGESGAQKTQQQDENIQFHSVSPNCDQFCKNV
jgi:hypothetical protein